MPIFFLFFIVFLLWFRVKLNKNKFDPALEDKVFWEREAKANFARAKDISNLDYLTLDLQCLPFSDTDDEEEAHLMDEVREFSNRKCLNLSGLSNTDLKEQYGVANLEYLSNCDQNYTLLLRALNNWGQYLYHTRDFHRAKTVLEYQLSLGSDISTAYTSLGEIYGIEGNLDSLDNLIQKVEESNLPLKSSTLKSLKITRLHY